MTNREKINDLALAAQKELLAGKGRTTNVWLLIAEFHGKINNLTQIHGNNFNDEVSFIERLEKKIEYAARYFKPEIAPFEALVNRTFRQTVSEFYKDKAGYKSLHDSIEYMTQYGSGNSLHSPRQISDEGSDVERGIISDEFCTSIIDEYGTDDKRKYILNRWIEEARQIKNTELAREMVGHFGGKENTHLQFVKRFRRELQQAL